MAKQKKRLIKSFETLSKELLDLVREQYPSGYDEHISRIKNAKNETIFVFPIETEDATYLIKIPVVKNSEGEYEKEDDDDKSDGDSHDAFEDNNMNDDMDDEDDSERRKGKKEASYDPDFD